MFVNHDVAHNVRQRVDVHGRAKPCPRYGRCCCLRDVWANELALQRLLRSVLISCLQYWLLDEVPERPHRVFQCSDNVFGKWSFGKCVSGFFGFRLGVYSVWWTGCLISVGFVLGLRMDWRR